MARFYMNVNQMVILIAHNTSPHCTSVHLTSSCIDCRSTAEVVELTFVDLCDIKSLHLMFENEVVRS